MGNTPGGMRAYLNLSLGIYGLRPAGDAGIYAGGRTFLEDAWTARFTEGGEERAPQGCGNAGKMVWRRARRAAALT